MAAPEPRAKKERVLKLEVQPLKEQMSASTEKLVVEKVLTERPNGVESSTSGGIMSRERIRAEKKGGNSKKGLREASESSVNENRRKGY